MKSKSNVPIGAVYGIFETRHLLKGNHTTTIDLPLFLETDEGDDEDTSEESDLDDQVSTRTNETCSDFAGDIQG